MIRKILSIRFRLLLMLFTGLSLMVWGITNANAAENITATVNYDGKPITVGDVIPLSLTVKHPVGYRLLAPNSDDIPEPFEWRGALSSEVSSLSDGSEVSNQTIQISLWVPGAYTLTPIPVRIIDTAGNVFTVETNPLNLTVDSVLIDGDTTLRDIKPQASLPMSSIWPWAIGALLALVVAAILFLRWQKQRNTPFAITDLRSVDQVALDELKHIEGLALPSKGRLKEHYTLTTDVLRQYLEKGFQIPALDQTTSEIRQTLNGSNFPSDVRLEFVRLLTSADLVKFAKFQPDNSEINSYIPRIRQLILEIKPEEQAQ